MTTTYTFFRPSVPLNGYLSFLHYNYVLEWWHKSLYRFVIWKCQCKVDRRKDPISEHHHSIPQFVGFVSLHYLLYGVFHLLESCVRARGSRTDGKCQVYLIKCSSFCDKQTIWLLNFDWKKNHGVIVRICNKKSLSSHFCVPSPTS